MKLLCFGMGYSAQATVALTAARLAHAWGTARSEGKAAAIAALGATPVIWPGATGGDTIERALAETSHVLVSIAPDDDGDPVLNAWSAALVQARPEAICYLSTVGVYGNHDGAWVDETSECRPVSARSRRRVAAEQAWADFGDKASIPVSIIRLAGIYGPGRGPFQKLKSGTSRRIIKPGQVFNRIHVDDIAQIAGAALIRRANGIFNGADDEPAPPQDVITFGADLLGIEPPPEVAFADADMTPMGRSFYSENKRVKNEKIKRDLGISLIHPTYREGLRAILAAERE